MRYRRLLLGVWTLAVVAASCSGASTGGTASGAAEPVPASNATAAALLPTDARALPDIDFAGYEKLISQLEGTPVYVNIWASWCGPCRAEAPHLTAAHDKHGEEIQFLGVDIQDSRDSARDFMAEFDWTYPSLFDKSGSVRDRLGFIGQPVSLFYDARGNLVSTWNGPIGAEQLQERLDEILS